MDQLAINAARRKLIIGASFVVFVIVFAILLSPKLVNKLGSNTGNALYAVFLANDQVYFGTITDETSRSLTLTNVYYLAPSASQDGKISDAALLKLGNEIHGPEDWLKINQDQILFVERLREDGKIAQAIRAYQPK
jgi:hypothetical protein